MKYLEINKKINIRISLSEYLGKQKQKQKSNNNNKKQSRKFMCLLLKF